MKLLKILFLLLWLSSLAFGSAIRGTLVNASGSALTGGTLTLTLSTLDAGSNVITGCGNGSPPNVRNSGTITNMAVVVTSGAGGALFGTVVGNDQINCGSGFGVGTFYHVIAKDASGTVQWTKDYNITGATWTPQSPALNTLPPSILPLAILSNPGSNQTITQPGGTSLTISGNVNITTLTATLIGNASTATALAAAPTSCVANTFATAIDTHANLTCSGVAPAQLPAAIVYNNQTNVLSGVTQFSNDLFISGFAGLPASTAGNIYAAGGYGTPVSGRLLVSDGSGWHLKISSRSNSTTDDPFTFLAASAGGFFGISPAVSLALPTISLAAGGTLATGTPVFYKITAIGPDGAETDFMPEVSITPSGANLSVTLGWTAVATAASYKIYRGTSANGESAFQTSATNSFTDTGAAGTAGTPPVFNNSYLTKLRNTTGSYIYPGLSIGQTAAAAYMLDVLGNSTVSLTNLGRFKAGASSNGTVTIDTTTTGFQSTLVFSDVGTTKWQIGKDSSNNGFMFEGITSVNRILLTASGNNTYSAGSLTGIHQFQHSDASLAAVNASQYQISGVALAAANLSNGVTGSGAVVLTTSPTITSASLVTPALGAATGTSLNLGATGVLSTTAQSGTGSLCMTTSCVMTTPSLGAATATSITGLTGSISPSAAGGINVGTAALPFSGIFIGGAATNNIRITGTATAARTLTLPDANSNPVQPATAAAHQFANAISAAGVITFAQPASTDLSDVATLATLTGTQALSSKTLDGASNGNSVTLLNKQDPTATLTGNALDQVVYTYTLPANTMRAGTGIRITSYVNHQTGSAAITYKVNFGGVVYTTTTPTDTAVAGERYSVTLFNNAGVTNAQSGIAEVFSGGAYGIGTLSSSAIDTTAAVVITLTFNAANTQQVQGRQFTVELLQ